MRDKSVGGCLSLDKSLIFYFIVVRDGHSSSSQYGQTRHSQTRYIFIFFILSLFPAHTPA